MVEVILLPNPDEYLYRIKRHGHLTDVIVHLTDAYSYGTIDFDTRPEELTRGSFVVMGAPHANYDESLVDKMRESGIGLGHVGKFMGALNFEKIWEYETIQEKEARLRKEQGLV